jgi:hypothetical protein
MNSGNRHEITVPRIIISAAGTRTVGPTGVLAVPTGRRVGVASIDPAQPNPLYDPSVGMSLIFSIGGICRGVNPAQGEGL